MAHQDESARTSSDIRWRSWLPWTAGAVGLLLTAIFYFSARGTSEKESREAIEKRFDGEASVRSQLVAEQVRHAFARVDLLEVYFETSRLVELSEFVEVSEKLMDQRSSRLESCYWAPLLAAEELDAHLERMRRDIPDYAYHSTHSTTPPPTETNSDDSTDESTVEELPHFPISYKQGDDGNLLPLGLDLTQDARLRKAMLEASRGDAVTAVPQGGSDNSFPLLTIVPHGRGSAGDRSTPREPDDDETAGVVIGYVDVAQVMRDTLASWDSFGFRMSIVHPDRTLIVNSDNATSEQEFVEWAGTPIDLNGLTLILRIEPPVSYFDQAERDLRPLLNLLIGLILTAASTGLLYRLVGRTNRIETLVLKRTSELRESNQQLEREAREREQAEDALNESLAAYQSLIESLPLNVFRKDLDGLIVDANQRFCDTIGHTLEETIGKSDFDLFPLAQAQKYRDDDERVLKSGEVLEDVEEHIKADGERLYVQVLKAPARDARGEIVGVQGMFWEVTSRVMAEEAQRLSDAKFRRLVDSDIIGVMTASLDGRILNANDEFLRIIMRDRDELYRGELRWDTLTPEEYRPLDDIAIHQLGETGACRPWEKEYLRRDGSRVPILIGVAMIDDSTDECICWVLDITDRKQMEDELKRAKEEADSASTAKSHFLANMSHEIRTPMNAIIGMTELVLQSPLTTEQRDYLKMVLHSGESLLGVINDILDFSKVEAGKLEVDAKPFHLVDTIGDTMKSLALRAHAKHIELACDVSPDLPEVLLGDGGRIRQVVLNLVGNAIKFTETGEVVVEVDLEREDEKAVVIHVSVRDTGIGIPQEKQQQIFAAFEQADATTTRRFGGTGLGLAITKRLVELMGGRLWVESEVEKGTTFHFTMLLDRCSESLELSPSSTQFDATNTRALIVDDSATNRQILSRVLSSWQMPHSVVETAADAMAELKMARFDIVIADANMPNVDGFDLVEQMRQLPAYQSTPVIILTSGELAYDRHHCERLGVSAHLLKPVKRSELYDALVEALATRVHVPSLDQAESTTTEVPPLRILLAEDSAVNQMLAKALLEREGHTVTIAHNGREAVQLSATMRFDLVLMDVQMPVQDGLDAAKDIRRRERMQDKSRLPIIALTAHAMKGDREKCLEAGMDEYLAKPIRAAELYATIAQVMEHFGKVRPRNASTDGQDSSTANYESAGDSPTLGDDGDRAPVKGPANEGGDADRPSPKAGADRATAPTADKPTADKPTADKPTADKPTADGALASTKEDLRMSSHPANQSSETGVQWQVDWNAALAAVNGSQSLLRELAAIFGSEGPRLQKQLEQALQEGDAPGLRIAAHTLKGSARYFGTNPVSELALKIEKLAMDEQLEAAEEPLRQLQTSLPLLLKAIQTIPEQASDA